MIERPSPEASVKAPSRVSRRMVLQVGGLVASALGIAGGSMFAWEQWLRDPWLRRTSPQLRMIPTYWQEYPDVPDIRWVGFGPDDRPGVTQDQKTWRQVAVVAAPVDSIHPFLGEDPDNMLVAAYRTGASSCRATTVGGAENLGLVRAGGDNEQISSRAHLAVGFMLGNGALGAALLGKRPGPNGRLINLPQLTPWPSDEPYTLDNIAHELPGVPVLRRQPA